MTLAAPIPDAALADLGPLFRLSVTQYHELMEAGILLSGDPIELLEGLLVQKMTKHPPHSGTVVKLRALIEPVLPLRLRYRAQEPMILSDGEPEPDGVIARGSADENFTSHPTAAETLLVIEVADASLARDRGVKLRSYARAGIAEYWIINLNTRQVEVYAEPDPSAVPQPTYRRRELLAADSAVPLTLDGVLIANLRLADFLPPR